MPELTEVERSRKDLCPYIGKTIIKAEATDDTIVFSKQNPIDVTKTILGKKILDVKRHGKVFWFELEGSYQLGFHYGMTGELKIKGKQLIKYRDSKTKDDGTWPPRWYKIMIYLSDNNSIIKNIDKWNNQNSKEKEDKLIKELDEKKVDCFCFCDVRRLGRVWLSKDIMNEKPLSTHGFDVMNELPPLEEFKKIMKTKTCGIKTLLLDQSFSAGVGNWIADEVLYQSRIHPLQNVKDLDDDDIKKIYDALKTVITTANSVNADSSLFPKNWIFHYRWSKRGNKKVSIPGVGNIEFLTAGGRTSAIVPSLQKLKKGSKGKEVKENNNRKIPSKKEVKEIEENENDESKVKRRRSNRLSNKEKNNEIEVIEETEEEGKRKAKGVENQKVKRCCKRLANKKENIEATKQEIEVKNEEKGNRKSKRLSAKKENAEEIRQETEIIKEEKGNRRSKRLLVKKEDNEEIKEEKGNKRSKRLPVKKNDDKKEKVEEIKEVKEKRRSKRLAIKKEEEETKIESEKENNNKNSIKKEEKTDKETKEVKYEKPRRSKRLLTMEKENNEESKSKKIKKRSNK